MLPHLTQALGHEPGPSAWEEISPLLPTFSNEAHWEVILHLLSRHVDGHGDTIYMLWNGKHFKIGRTSRSLHMRRKELGENTIVAAALSAHHQLESKLHRVFETQRRHGEWFRPSTTLHRLARLVNGMQQIAFPRAHALYATDTTWQAQAGDLVLARECLQTWRAASRAYLDYAWYDARPDFT